MALLMNPDVDEVCTPTVKNTFIDLQFIPACALPRRKSVPPSLRLCADNLKGDENLPMSHVDTDASTDAHTDASNDGDDGTASEFAVSTPRSYFGDSSTSQTAGLVHECSECAPEVWSPVADPPKPSSEYQRLNAKATAFKPQTAGEETVKPHFKMHIANVIRVTMAALQGCEYASHVEVCETAGDWSIVIQARGKGDWQTERLLTVAKEALLDATSESKSIYVMGYAAPQPFSARPQGFEATLGAMANATKACWHVFKKGFCRHGIDCCKEHPACQTRVHVLVESAQLNSSVRFVKEFSQEVADLAMSVTKTFRECAYVEAVESFQDSDDQGWRVEVTSREEDAAHKDYLLSIAKNALYTATNASKHVYIMGYAAKPFVPKSQGFVAMLGDMQDEAKACWNLYSKGTCQMDCACRWKHPECLLPINVVVKASSPPSAVLDYLFEGEEIRSR